MSIARIPAKDFAISRFALSPDQWLEKVFDPVCGGDLVRLQALYDTRAEAQMNADQETPEWAAASGADDWSRYLAAGLPTLAELQAEVPQLMPPSTPRVITDRQFAQGLAIRGFISQQEALDWVSAGTLPAAIAAFVDSVPDPVQQFAARMLLTGATIFERDHPLVAEFGDQVSLDAAELDELWAFCASL